MDLKTGFRVSPKKLSRVLFDDFDLKILFDNLNMDMLLVRFLNASKSNYAKYQQAIAEVEKIRKEIILNRYIVAKGIYQIFKVRSYKDRLVFYQGEEMVGEMVLEVRNGISIADFLYEDDFVSLTSASCFLNLDASAKLGAKKSFLIQSVCIMLAEAFTEVLHFLSIKDMGIENNIEMRELYRHKNIGKRYSPGYPGIDISQNASIHRLLSAQDIGSRITSSYMIDPESSVQSLIIYNPKAFYL